MITRLQVDYVGEFGHVSVWVRGQKSGCLTCPKSDAFEIALRLAADNECHIFVGGWAVWQDTDSFWMAESETETKNTISVWADGDWHARWEVWDVENPDKPRVSGEIDNCDVGEALLLAIAAVASLRKED